MRCCFSSKKQYALIAHKMEIRPILSAVLFMLICIASPADVIISEFMASNVSTLLDEDNEYSDWIEIFNNGTDDVSLLGWGLSDSSNNLYKWTFPDVIIPANERIVIFASDKNKTDPTLELHTNFKLSSSGEYLALTDPSGKIHSEFSPAYPPQYPDVSYGESSVKKTSIPINGKTSTLQYYIPKAEEFTLDTNWMKLDFEEQYPALLEKFKNAINAIGFETPSTLDIPAGVDTILMTQPDGYWRFNEKNGQNIVNEGTKGNYLDLSIGGTIKQGVNGVQGNLFPGFESDNAAYQFGNRASYVFGNSILNDLTSFTLSGWIKPNSDNYSRTGLFGQNDAIEFGIISKGQLHLWTPTGVSMYANVDFQINNWYHVAITGDESNVSIYINGARISNTRSPGSSFGYSDYPFTIGGRIFDAADGEFDGIIDEVTFHSRALTEAEINRIYKSATERQNVKEYISSLNPPAWWSMENRTALQYNGGTLGYNLNCSRQNLSRVDGPRISDNLPGFSSDNYAASFTGNSRIQVDYNDALNTKEFSISAWVKPTQKNNGCSPIFSSRNYGPYNGYMLMINEEGKWSFVLTEQTSSQKYVIGSSVQYDQWSLVQGTFDGETARLYLNGELVASERLSNFIPNPTQKSRIGYGSPTGGDYFIGTIDEVFYLDRAMTPEECQELYSIAIGNNSGIKKDTYYFKDIISTDLREEVENISTSVYTRYSFQIEDLDNLNQLTLNLKYIDGITVWLNGYMIIQENSPETVSYNSIALSERLSKLGSTAVKYDITPYKDLLHPGNNVLAVQLLRKSTESPNMLLHVEMEATFSGQESHEWRYLLAPSPGKPNGEGTEDLGPIISDPSCIPALPTLPEADEPIIVLAQITPSQFPVSEITLTWRSMFLAQNTLEMFDDGLHGDGIAGDGIYGAIIPPNSARPGQMIRWYITATDSQGNKSRWPLFNKKTDSEEYLGTIIRDTSIDTSLLPVLHLFAENTSAMNSGSDTRISAFYNGEFYDNILIQRRGQTTSGFSKKPYKLDFNKDHQFMYGTNTPRVGKVNLMSNYADKTKMHNTLAHEYIIKGGSVGHWCFPIRIQRNGTFFSVAEMLENGTEDWLERIGWDPDGLLFKVYDNLSSAYSAEKKTRSSATDAADRRAYQEFINSISESVPLTNRVVYSYDHINIPQTISYFATLALISSQDHGHKNFYIYQDSNITGEWSILPWDVDLSWGRNWLDSGGYFVDTLYTNNVLNFYNQSQQAKSSNRLYNLFFSDPGFRAMYLTRLRSLADEFLQSSEIPAKESQAAHSINYYLDLIDPESVATSDADLDNATWSSWSPVRTVRQEADRTIDTYIAGRSRWLSSKSATLNGSTVPPATPANAAISLNSIEFQPSTKDPMHKYICLTNENSYALDISGWKITSPMNFTFYPGTVLPAKSSIYVTPSQTGFRSRKESPRGGESRYLTGPWQGELSARGGTIQLYDNKDRLIFEEDYTGNPSPMLNHLRITEIMYNPLPMLPDYTSEDLKYIELKNVSSNSIFSLSGASFTDGIQYTFNENIRLFPQERIVIAKNIKAFQARYGDDITVVGPFEGNLSNSGETIRLEDANHEVILEFSYKDSWEPATDGDGYSLVCVNDQANWEDWGLASQWKCSHSIYGSPGKDDTPHVDIPRVKINEVLANTGKGEEQAIEIFNSESNDADISYWHLSNEYNTPKQYMFPAGTIIPANSYHVVTSKELGFELNPLGDDIWIFSANKKGELTGYVHGFTFETQNPGITYGRIVISTGDEHFVPQSENTLGFTNSGALIYPIVFEEIMYHPPTETDDNIRDEYIKLVNTSTVPIPLYDAETGIGYLFTKGITFQFSTNHIIPARGVVLIVSFDPINDKQLLQEFMTQYNIDEWNDQVVVTGPYSGKLSNSGETLRLVKTQLLGESSIDIIIDTLTYQDSSPWPGKADGKGSVLQRRDLFAYADDPANWSSKAPSPNTPLEMPEPVLSWNFQDGQLVLSFTGELYESTNMKDWIPVKMDIPKADTYIVDIPQYGQKYYRIQSE